MAVRHPKITIGIALLYVATGFADNWQTKNPIDTVHDYVLITSHCLLEKQLRILEAGWGSLPITATHSRSSRMASAGLGAVKNEGHSAQRVIEDHLPDPTLRDDTAQAVNAVPPEESAQGCPHSWP